MTVKRKCLTRNQEASEKDVERASGCYSQNGTYLLVLGDFGVQISCMMSCSAALSFKTGAWKTEMMVMKQNFVSSLCAMP